MSTKTAFKRLAINLSMTKDQHLKIIGLLAVGSFWIVLVFHYLQIYEAWSTGFNIFDPFFSLLSWTISTSFYAWGLAKRDFNMVSSRFPASIATSLSFFQNFTPRFGVLELMGALIFNIVTFYLLYNLSKDQQSERLLFHTGRIFFTFGYTVGLAFQVYRIVFVSTQGAFIPYWYALLVASIIWCLYGWYNSDRWQSIVFGIVTILCTLIVMSL